MSYLILMRHGQSQWNKLNLFTGWVDVPLSNEGIEEALKGGDIIKDYPIDVIFTSSLIRAIMTAMLVMNVHHSKKVPVIQHEEKKLKEWGTNYGKTDTIIPVYCCSELNERMYGELQGLNKAETIQKFGAEQVQIWRRSYSVSPPHGESLKNVAEDRSIPFFKKEILPLLEKGKNVFIAAHGNSLRSIIMYLNKLSEEEVLTLELDTGHPIIYEFAEGLLKEVK